MSASTARRPDCGNHGDGFPGPACPVRVLPLPPSEPEITTRHSTLTTPTDPLMSEELVGNLLVAQSGGPTPVINASLAGVIAEALKHEENIEEIFGGLNGIQGILREELIDLASES